MSCNWTNQDLNTFTFSFLSCLNIFYTRQDVFFVTASEQDQASLLVWTVTFWIKHWMWFQIMDWTLVRYWHLKSDQITWSASRLRHLAARSLNIKLTKHQMFPKTSLTNTDKIQLIKKKQHNFHTWQEVMSWHVALLHTEGKLFLNLIGWGERNYAFTKAELTCNFTCTEPDLGSCSQVEGGEFCGSTRSSSSTPWMLGFELNLWGVFI